EVFHMRYGGGGAATRFVCGYLALSRSVFRPLFEALPRVLCIRIGDGPASALVRALFREGVRESAAQGPGAASTLAKVAELRFVEALRRYMAELPPQGKGWLAGVRDPPVGRALALLHGTPGKGWTVGQPAQELALLG